MKRRVAFFAIAPLLATCVGVTEERARRDEQIGKGELSGASFEVLGGLACIRRLEPGVLSLWAQAPVLRVHVRTTAGAPVDWTLTIDNTLPAATLETEIGPGEMPTIVPLSAARPTEKRWTVSLPPGIDATLALRPAGGEPTGTWRFAVLSDIQEAIDRVQDIFGRMNADPSIEFVASAGDLTTRGAPEQLERFQRELERLTVPYFATLGNHELGSDDGAPFQSYFGRGNFHFVYGGLAFTFLDSASATIDARAYGWLTSWLDDGRDRIQVVLMHIPPIDPVGVRNGSFADRNEAAKLLAKLAGGGVDLTLYGHIHTYYAFSNAGIQAHISGGGGAIPERFDGIGRHYLTVDVDPRAGVLQTGFVRIDGD